MNMQDTAQKPASDSHDLFEDAFPPRQQSVSVIPVVPQLTVAIGLLVMVFAVTYVGATKSLKEQRVADTVERESTLAWQTNEISPLQSAFNDLTLEGKAAIVWDMREKKVLHNKNGGESRPLASITKLMTALVAYELMSPEDRVKVTLRSLEADGDSGLADGEEFTMQNLTDLMLISSSNDGALALSATGGMIIADSDDPEHVFVTAMNVRAKELGLTQTVFKNSTGLDLSPDEAGAYGSAHDVALLLAYILENVPDAVAITNLDVTTIENEKGEYHLAKNTNSDVSKIEGLIASKTGYTELSGGNLAVAFNAGLNRPIIVVVLGSSYEGRFKDTELLIERTRRYLGRHE